MRQRWIIFHGGIIHREPMTQHAKKFNSKEEAEQYANTSCWKNYRVAPYEKDES